MPRTLRHVSLKFPCDRPMEASKECAWRGNQPSVLKLNEGYMRSRSVPWPQDLIRFPRTHACSRHSTKRRRHHRKCDVGLIRSGIALS